MEVTEVRIKLMEDGSDRLKAFCSITLDDCFVIRDLKIILGTTGPFVAMPSRKLTSHCPGCGCKNHLRAPYCNQCGERLNDDRAIKDDDGRTKLYADIAHPINTACREMIQVQVIREYNAEQQRSQEPGYTSRYDEFEFDTPEPHFQPSRAAVETPRETPSEETSTRFEPPENRRTGPHTPPTRKQNDDSSSRRSRPGDFGDGIL